MVRALCLLAGVLALACSRDVAPTMHATHTLTSSPALWVEPPAGATTPAPTSTELPAIERGVCPPALADLALPYFGDRVLVRLPAGVSDAALVEYSPNFARSAAAVTARHCRDESPSATIAFLALVHFDDERPSASLEQVRDELLDALAYPRERVAVAHEAGAAARGGTWVFEVPATREHPVATKLLIAIAREQGKLTTLIYELEPVAWPLLVDSLVASARQLESLP